MAEKISEWVMPALVKLTRLDARTQQVFPEGDLLRRRVSKALYGMPQYGCACTTWSGGTSVYDAAKTALYDSINNGIDCAQCMSGNGTELRMNSRTIITIAAVLVTAILLPFAVIHLLGERLSNSDSKFGSSLAVITLFANAYLFAAHIYYFKSEAAYLWIQRLLLRFRRTHTYWRFTVSYNGIDPLIIEGKSRVHELNRMLVDAARVALAGRVTAESMATGVHLLIDDRDRFEFAFDVEEDRLALHTSKMLVPNHLYWRTLDRLTAFYDAAEKIVRPRETDYRLEVAFERNPYFGFFVRHVPERLLTYFRCTFQSSISPDCRIEATKEAVYLNCTSNATLNSVARGYLSLSDRLITKGSE